MEKSLFLSKLQEELEYDIKLDLNTNIKELPNTNEMISSITNEKLKEKILNNLK